MRTIRAILDPTNPDSTTLHRSVLIAQQQSADLELFCVVHEPAHAFDLFHLTDREANQAHQEIVAATRATLEDLAKQLALPNVSVEVAWGYPFDATVLQSIEDRPPDLVVMGLRRAHHPSRKEWHLIRGCRPDLLIVKDSKWTEPPQVMACLDPSHRHAKPTGLDHCIFDSAMKLATTTGKMIQFTPFQPQLLKTTPDISEEIATVPNRIMSLVPWALPRSAGV